MAKELEVVVVSASSLKFLDKDDKVDPMVVVEFQGVTKETGVEHVEDPKWNKTFKWSLSVEPQEYESISISVFDHEWFRKNRLLGETEVRLGDVMMNSEPGKPYDVTRKLHLRNSELDSTITLRITYNFPNAGKKREKKVSVANDVTDGKQEEQESEDDHDKIQTTSDHNREIKKKSRQENHGHKRSSFPNKPTDFQVRVHVIEAHQLPGGNLNPLVKVICCDKTKRTMSVKGTNRPYFDEILFFNMNECPDEFFDRTLEIKVINAKTGIYQMIDTLKWDQELIGSFQMDLGWVYDEPDHSFIHKWLLLTDPEAVSSGVRGYLKVSVNVIAPGDNIKPSVSVMSPESVDIEANLLRPSGIRLQSATLSICIYRADDLPQMDPGYFERIKKTIFGRTTPKELVDPYCTVKFAGHGERTQILMNKQYPKWNEQLNLGIRFPSVSDRIRIRLKDYDKLSKDDIIGTCFLHLSEISAIGGDGIQGFLPKFGPCYINVYGSPREFTDLPDKYDYLNKGGMKGVAYRGRVMVEVSVETGKLPSQKCENIKDIDVKSLDQYLSKTKYKLFGVFFSATMIKPTDSSVELEISIGNYGNKLDHTLPSQMSTTSPATPIFDENAYYYLPWLQYKPCVIVESDWEDVSYRINSQNFFLSITDELTQKLDEVYQLMSHDVDGKSQEILTSAIDTIIKHIGDLVDKNRLPKVPRTGVYNDLDRQKYRVRIEQLKLMRRKAKELDRKSGGKPKLDHLLDLAENFQSTLHNLAIEPQNSVPDVFIWMLSGNKRVAYHRIPSHELMFSEIPMCCGKKCGKILNIQMKPPAVEKEEDLEGTDPAGALLRVYLWLGLKKYESNCNKSAAIKDVAVYAETYHNQAYCGGWGKKGLMRPEYSDASGKINQPIEVFNNLPDGWEWEDDKFEVKPDLSITCQPDKGLYSWEEEVYEYQCRYPFSNWPSESSWRDVHGDELTDAKSKKKLTYKDIQPPPGWKWKDEWHIDKQRAVDDNGWEYCFGPGMGSWNPSERANHHTRRRRWVRTRKRASNIGKPSKDEKKDSDSWEYARFHDSTYHSTDGMMFLARRQRLMRKMRPVAGSSKPPIFYLKDKKIQLVPRMFVPLEECHCYQLRAYFYQARELYAGDKTGFSDPYCVVSFGQYSKKTLVKEQTLTPVWNETCLFENVEIFGNKDVLKESPPHVVIELYDEDSIGQDDFLGVVKCFPNLRFSSAKEKKTRLTWHEINRYGHYAGELLAAFELLDDEIATLHPYNFEKDPETHHLEVPKDIRPKVVQTKIEVHCWGLRDMKKFHLLPVDSPIVEIECGDQMTKTDPIKSIKKNPNFPDNTTLSMTLELPEEPIYAPPFTIRVYDRRLFGQTPLVGSCVIKSLEKFIVSPPQESDQMRPLEPAVSITVINEEEDPQEVAIDFDFPESKTDQIFTDPDARDAKYDWWSKYYASIKDEKRTQNDYLEDGYDILQVYDNELEKNFDNFFDLVHTFPLYRSKGMHIGRISEEKITGKFKGAIKIYQSSFEPKTPQIQSHEPVKVVVRVYIVKGIRLMACDPNGKSDPYIKIKLGKNKIDDSENYLSNTLNPVFGKMFEIPATFPHDHTLTIEVNDHDVGTPDDLIGETSIDLENRYWTLHRARCGLPKTYFKGGPNNWRDDKLPHDILNQYCDEHEIEEPLYEGPENVIFNKRRYTLNQFEKDITKKKRENKYLGPKHQRLALHILNEIVESNFVPEHLENRTLYNPAHPGIPQGSLQMWVDIFSKSGYIPPPVDISPRKPEPYVLRVVVYNTKEIELDETSVVTGEDMSDIYVKAWLQGQDETQKTDVHYRSMDGEGNFNWRFVFPFDYLLTEQTMIIRKKEHFYSLGHTELERDPLLTMQVWDNDMFSPDDFLGTVDFNLTAIPCAAKSHVECSLDQLPDSDHHVKLNNLFEKKRMKGWWPVYKLEENGKKTSKGKIELELEILTSESEKQFPAGKGRDEPNMYPHLPKPNRPETSFLWITSPYKTFKYIIWRYYKWHIIFGIALVLAILLLVVFIYSAPEFLAQYLLDRILPF